MKELTAHDRYQERQRIAEEQHIQRAIQKAVQAERKRIVDLLMIQHEAAKGAHNYWQVAANLVQADVASDT